MARIACLLALALALVACQSTSPTKSKADTAKDRIKLAEINTQLAIAYMRDGDNELALKKLEKAVEADPKSAGAHNALGLLYTRLGEADQAEQHYKAALSLEPKNYSALNNYGQFLCQQTRFEEGQARFQEAIKNPLNRAPENALTNAGTCALQAKDRTGAEQHFRAALQIDPRLAPALLSMAQLSVDQENYLQARGYYQRYLEVGPQNPRTLWLGIRIEHGMDDQDSVSSYAMKLKNKFPDSPEYSLFQQGKFD